jgi:pantoate--beta-alanine ligase
MSASAADMVTIGEPGDVRRWCDVRRSDGRRIGFVPTMGYLHQGHLSLVELARQAADDVIVSIFVNPLQFGPSEDLGRYPRDFARDSARCRSAGVGLLFAPTVAQMYPRPIATTVEVPALGEGLCGRDRPGHFAGVCTVVARLFNIVGPCVAVFGQKDYQQLAIVRRMVLDLAFPVDVLAGPIVREADGLAMSSRNAYLTAEQRRAATVLSRALERVQQQAREGPLTSETVQGLVAELVATEPLVRLQYVQMVDAATLAPLDNSTFDGEAVVALAAWVGDTRLIDNVLL